MLTGPRLVSLAQDGGGPSLLPDWLADAPPWLQALALAGAMIAAIALATATVWAPALADRIRGRAAATPPPPPPPESGSSEAQAGSRTTTSGPALQQYDAKMELIGQLASGLQRSLDDAEEKMADLQATIDSLKDKLAEARIEIGRLSYQRDMLLQQRVEPPRPPGS